MLVTYLRFFDHTPTPSWLLLGLLFSTPITIALSVGTKLNGRPLVNLAVPAAIGTLLYIFLNWSIMGRRPELSALCYGSWVLAFPACDYLFSRKGISRLLVLFSTITILSLVWQLSFVTFYGRFTSMSARIVCLELLTAVVPLIPMMIAWVLTSPRWRNAQALSAEKATSPITDGTQS